MKGDVRVTSQRPQKRANLDYNHIDLLVEPLGKGASGTVHEAYDRHEKGSCAIKELALEVGQAKVDVLSRLQNPKSLSNASHIVQVRHSFKEKGMFYIVTDLHGDSLERFRRRNGTIRLPPSGVRQIARQLFEVAACECSEPCLVAPTC